MAVDSLTRPYVTVVLAASADGKIADCHRSAARFPSAVDKAHLEAQIASADATLFGAGTLRAYGTTLPVANRQLIASRRQRQQPDQPVHIVCSASGQLDRRWRFFQQPVPRWLLTTPSGARAWHNSSSDSDSSLDSDSSSDAGVSPARASVDTPLKGERQAGRRASGDRLFFNHILQAPCPLDWPAILHALRMGRAMPLVAAGVSEAIAPEHPIDERLPVKRLLVMGGGELVASLLAEQLVDELYLTICPVLIGGRQAPTPVGGDGFMPPHWPRLKLQSARVVADEVFLHYCIGQVGEDKR